MFAQLDRQRARSGLLSTRHVRRLSMRDRDMMDMDAEFCEAIEGNRTMGFYRDHIVPHLINLAMRNHLLAPYRERIVGMAEGRVVEVGLGSGMNLPFYTNRVKEVIGLEPHPKLLVRALGNPASVPAKLIEGSAESI